MSLIEGSGRTGLEAAPLIRNVRGLTVYLNSKQRRVITGDFEIPGQGEGVIGADTLRTAHRGYREIAGAIK